MGTTVLGDLTPVQWFFCGFYSRRTQSGGEISPRRFAGSWLTKNYANIKFIMIIIYNNRVKEAFLQNGTARACLKIALCQPCVTVCTQGYDMGDLFRMRAL